MGALVPRDHNSKSTSPKSHETKVKETLLKSKWLVSVLGGAALFALLGSTFTAAPASASPSAEATIAPSSSLTEGISSPSTASQAEWDAELEQLLASDVRRTATEYPSHTLYTFHLDIEGEGIPDNYVLDYSLERSNEGAVSPRFTFGSNRHGPYLDLNHFDQDMVISGGAAIIAAGACAIPIVGNVSCLAITAALTVAAVTLAHNGKCPGAFRIYLNRPRYEPHYVCV